MKRYAVIDTNVLVSAMLKWTSVPGNIIEFAFNGVIIPVLNERIVAEYRAVLMREKFHLTKEIVDDVIQALEDQGEYIDTDKMDYKLPDPKDVVFLRNSYGEAERRGHISCHRQYKAFPYGVFCRHAKGNAGYYFGERS